MKVIRIAIVEDEEKYRKTFTEFIHQYARENGLEMEIVMFKDGDEITERYAGDYDIILMDIMMRFMDGMTAAEKIRTMDEKVIIIFITNMINYAIRGYQVGAFDYILKPVTYFALQKSLQRAMKQLIGDRDIPFLTVNTTDGVQKIQLPDLLFVESDAHYLNFHTSRGIIRTYMRMKDAENDLQQEHFFRINKGVLVNLRYVDGLEGNDCRIGEHLLPISRGRKKEFLAAMNQSLRR